MGALTVAGAVAGLGAAAVIVASRLGRTYGATRSERAASLPGDGIVPRPQVVTDHAITIDAPPAAVWPWLVQMGWNRGGWYTARWVDRLLFPANGPSATTPHRGPAELAGGRFHPGRATAHPVRLDRRAARSGTCACPALDQSPAAELAGPRRGGLVLGVRPHSGRRWPALPLPLPVPLGDRPLVVHPRSSSAAGAGRLCDGPRHAPRHPTTRRRTPERSAIAPAGSRPPA